MHGFRVDVVRSGDLKLFWDANLHKKKVLVLVADKDDCRSSAALIAIFERNMPVLKFNGATKHNGNTSRNICDYIDKSQNKEENKTAKRLARDKRRVDRAKSKSK